MVWRAIFTRRIMYAVAFAVVFGTACFFLGRWQLSRYEDKDARANAVEQNYHAAAVPLLSVLPTASTPLPEERIWTPVTVTGQYAASGQLLVRGRALNTAQGMEVLVPFRVDGGAILLVDRGWVPNGDQAADLPTVPPAPAGSVTLTGWLKPSEEAREKGLPAGQLATINLEQAQAQIDGRLYAAYLVLGSESLVAALATAMVYGVGGLMAVSGSLTVGTLLALAALLARLYGPLTALSNVRVDVMTALVSFDRVFEVLDLQPLVAQAPHPVRLPDGPVEVQFEDVAFSYPSADEVSLRSLESTASGDRAGGGPVLQAVSFTAYPGQLVALVGPSGGGKTTMTSLVARLYDPTDGVVRIGGVDLREASFASLHETVGMVTQEAHLFHDTIRENLRYAAPDATEEQMRAALEAAQVLHLVDSLPSGLDTVVGDRGHRLSGGEKQRLAIARLLLKAPHVVVLDEATAHLDSESEVAVQRALDVALAGRTALVIAHRLSTVRGADQILVVEDGRIVERGKHAELLGRGGLYADLYRTQYFEDSTTKAGPW